MEVHQYEFSKQKNTSTDLANKEVAVKKEDPFKHSEQFSTNSALCDTEIKSEEDFYRDIKDEIIENEPNPNLNINLEEIATDFYGDLVSGKNDPQLSLIKKPVKKEKLCISNEYEIKLTKSDEVDIHLEHVKIEKVEPSGSELFFSCEVCKKVFVNEKDLIEHKSDKIDCIALEVDENDWNQEDKLTQESGKQQTATNKEAVIEEITITNSSMTVCESEQLSPNKKTKNNDGTASEKFQCETVRSGTQFKCKKCPKFFSTNFNRLLHQRIHEGVVPFECHLCSMSFTRLSTFRAHERAHIENAFRCRKCPKSFSTKSALCQHEQVHGRNGPFQCKLCSKCFESNSCLLEHESRHKFYPKSFTPKAYL